MQNYFKIIALIFIFQLAANLAPAQQTNNIQTLAELRERIQTELAQPRFDGAIWGVKIISLDSGQTIFEDHADRLMSPASNSKLYTGALALDKFGGDYQIVTPIYATAKPNRFGTIHGNLIIAGHGDPSWNARRFGTNFWDIFEPFISALTNAGVRRVTGDLIADATFFRGPPFGSSWTADDLQEAEAGEISALTLNDNVAQVRVQPGAKPGEPCELETLQPATGLVFSNCTLTVTNGGDRHIENFRPLDGKIIYILGQLPVGGAEEILDIGVPRPADWFAAALKEALARNGIKISGKVRSTIWPENPGVDFSRATKIGEVLSPPLREIIRGFMKPSQNLETDLLFEHVGETARDSNSPPWETSEELAVAALEKFLAKTGAQTNEVQFDEGSGLSRNNLTTANATVALLQVMAAQTNKNDFINALPVAGVDGTLRRRMKSTPAAGNVRAKTGTLRWANSLSGYVTSAAGERLAFSIMLNRYEPPPGFVKSDELDAIAVMLAGFAGRSAEDFELLEKTYAPFGQLIVTQFVSAPFPHPARAAGHKYQDLFFSAAEHYSNSDVAIFIPKNFRATDKVDFVVHFHGWNNTVAGTLAQFKLIEQFSASGKNAILIVPEGPHYAPDSFGGKLEDTNGFKNFMAEAVEKIGASGAISETNFEIGNIIISGHSGGYHVMAAILDHGGLSEKIREAWLFDALYGNTQNFVAWQKNQHGRLLDIYTDHGGTKEETENLMQFYKTNSVSFFAGEETNSTPKNLLANKLVFLHTDLTHNEVIFRRDEFERFLETSCLQSQ
jgi:D-alanyl-D-alanine carboxypeptidase/D-alanyl-D-alanine-endopeptidase (penicillin-binding protein 4)